MRLTLKISLRWLLALVTLTCVGLGVWTHSAREQARIIRQIRISGGSIRYDFERTRGTQQGQSNVPRFLLDSLGADFFHEIDDVEIHDPRDLVELPRFRKLTVLRIYSHTLVDADLAPIAQLRQLRGLDIYGDRIDPNTQISDRSLKLLATLPLVELVNVQSSRITAQGLAALAHSKSLRKLYVASPHHSMEQAAAEPLQAGFTHVILRRSIPGGFGKIVAKWDGGQPPGRLLPAPSP